MILLFIIVHFSKWSFRKHHHQHQPQRNFVNLSENLWFKKFHRKRRETIHRIVERIGAEQSLTSSSRFSENKWQKIRHNKDYDLNYKFHKFENEFANINECCHIWFMWAENCKPPKNFSSSTMILKLMLNSNDQTVCFFLFFIVILTLS